MWCGSWYRPEAVRRPQRLRARCRGATTARYARACGSTCWPGMAVRCGRVVAAALAQLGATPDSSGGRSMAVAATTCGAVHADGGCPTGRRDGAPSRYTLCAAWWSAAGAWRAPEPGDDRAADRGHAVVPGRVPPGHRRAQQGAHRMNMKQGLAFGLAKLAWAGGQTVGRAARGAMAQVTRRSPFVLRPPSPGHDRDTACLGRRSSAGYVRMARGRQDRYSAGQSDCLGKVVLRFGAVRSAAGGEDLGQVWPREPRAGRMGRGRRAGGQEDRPGQRPSAAASASSATDRRHLGEAQCLQCRSCGRRTQHPCQAW